MDDESFLEHKQKKLEEILRLISNLEEEQKWPKQK
jgi:hypothetical protein